jgi:hypothetical protein
MADEYIIYCDESSEKGKYFSDFYGGALVRSDHIDEVKAVLVAKKLQLHFGGEVKWSKIPGNKYYAQKYITLMHCFFDLVAAGKIKVRIIFRQNAVIPRHLTEEQIERKYFILPVAPEPNSGSPLEARWYLGFTPGVLRRTDKTGTECAAIPLSRFVNGQP